MAKTVGLHRVGSFRNRPSFKYFPYLRWWPNDKDNYCKNRDNYRGYEDTGRVDFKVDYFLNIINDK